MKRYLFVLTLCCCLSSIAHAQHLAIDEIRRALVLSGLEDVAVVEEEHALYITCSDYVYRGVARGAYEVFRRVSDESEVDKAIHLVLQENGIPQVALVLPEESLAAYRNQTISRVQLMSSVLISYDTDRYHPIFKGVKPENRSAGKIDFVLYPQITLNNSWIDKLYGVIVNIAPAMEIGLWKGASFTGQVIFPIWNNMTGEMDYIRAGMLVFRQEYRFPKNVFMAFNIGHFNNRRIGTDLAFKYIPDNDRWEVGVNAGVTGSSTFYSGKWEVSKWRKVSGGASLRYNAPIYNLQFDLSGQRYVYGDYGVRLDCTRHFGEVAIGLYGMYTGGDPNGGFHFTVPISAKKRAKRRAVRLSVPEYFDWEYQAQSGNEYFQKRRGRFYETRPDQNQSQRYYHPQHLKEMLVVLALEELNKNE